MENNNDTKKDLETPLVPKNESPNPDPQKKEGAKHIVRSLETDMSNEIKEHQGAIVQIAIAESEKKEKMREAMSISSKTNIFFLVAGAIFLISALIFTFISLKKTELPVYPSQNNSSQIITADEERLIDISGLSKIKMSGKIIEIAKEQSDATVKRIILEEKGPSGTQKITLQRFLTTMEASANEKLARSLASEFMLGSFNCLGAENCPSGIQMFLIAKITDPNGAFTGMKEWETYMQEGLSPLFRTRLADNSLDSAYELSFQNDIIDNKPARFLRSKAGKEAGLIYMFAGKDNLIISEGEESATEALSRLGTQ